MTSEAALPRPAAWRSPVCFAVVAVLVVADLWTKSAVFAFLEVAELEVSGAGYHRYPVWGEWLAWMRNLNYGAAFGQGSGMPWVLVPLRAVALVVVSVLILRAPVGQRAPRTRWYTRDWNLTRQDSLAENHTSSGATEPCVFLGVGGGARPASRVTHHH